VTCAEARYTPMTRMLSEALKSEVAEPTKLLALAVIGTAQFDGETADSMWFELADLEVPA
jgi:hypothetical protein